MANINYPAWVDTNEKKLKFLNRIEELYRKLYNAMGKWFRDGLTQTQYDKLPDRVKNRYSYTPKLTAEQWRDFEYDAPYGYDNVMNKVMNQRHIVEQSFKDDKTMDVDIERDIS